MNRERILDWVFPWRSVMRETTDTLAATTRQVQTIILMLETGWTQKRLDALSEPERDRLWATVEAHLEQRKVEMRLVGR